MRLLVLGGTQFLSRAVAADAVARGHDVTCAARGESGRGARRRDPRRPRPGGARLVGARGRVGRRRRRRPDAVLGGRRRWTTSPTGSRTGRSSPRSACTPTTRPRAAPPRRCRCSPPITEDVEQDTAEKYGASKVACEQDVQARAREALVVRPGLIIGPGDPSGRFSYWPERLAEGGDVLAPESPDRDTQAIDVRDLAAWIVTCAEQRLHRGVRRHRAGSPRLGDLRRRGDDGVGGDATLVWAPADFLLERDVRYWAGPRSLPLWLPEEMPRDDLARRQRGLRRRPDHPADRARPRSTRSPGSARDAGRAARPG